MKLSLEQTLIEVWRQSLLGDWPFKVSKPLAAGNGSAVALYEGGFVFFIGVFQKPGIRLR